jgi:hypothetical protein
MDSSYPDIYPIIPNPQERMVALTKFYDTIPATEIMNEALGKRSTPLPATPPIAKALIEYIVTICVDTEAWTSNTDEPTEVGLAYLERKHVAGTKPGDHGVNFLKQLQFFHLRLMENTHLKSNNKESKGAEGNRFGHSRFVTIDEAKSCMDELFNQYITDKPELAGCKRPVILIGHALLHDEKNIKRLEYDFSRHGNLVAKVDTQPLVRDVNMWSPPPTAPKNMISLQNLCDQVVRFKHEDPHTACNDAARTMICAIWLALPTQFRQDPEQKMQQIATDLEQHSKSTSHAHWGTEHHCTRCGGRDHFNDGTCEVLVKCAACARFDTPTPGEAPKVYTHIEQHCTAIADFKAWARRYVDAAKKNRRRPEGPPKGSYPWSTWTGKWPLNDSSDLLGCEPYKTQLRETTSAGKDPAPEAPNAVKYALGQQSHDPGQGLSRGGRGRGRGSGRGGYGLSKFAPNGRGHGFW